MFDGSYKYPGFTKFTRQMAPSKHTKISSLVSLIVCFFRGQAHNLSDVFKPLFEVTKDPRSHPELHVFLQRVIGFDTVDDESKVERRIHKKFPYPRLWDFPQSPPYSYWYASIYPLQIIK